MNEQQSTEGPLSESERARIRAEMRYAMLAAQEARPGDKPRSFLDKILGYLSNGFVLLVLGSLITSALVPHFQREYEQRMKQAALKQECLNEFLVYSNSIWQEFYRILPLTLESEIGKVEYVRVVNDISVIKLKRYDAFAKVQALAIVFRASNEETKSNIEEDLNKYALSVNNASQVIDKWLSDLYCTPAEREESPCATFDPNFDAYAGYQHIQQLVLQVGNERAQQVTESMVKLIK